LGQHPTLDPADYGLDNCPAERFYCTGQDDPHVHAGLVSKASIGKLAEAAPHLLVVQGDTSSALGAALAGNMLDPKHEITGDLPGAESSERSERMKILSTS
jgi:hypothetical protein